MAHPIMSNSYYTQDLLKLTPILIKKTSTVIAVQDRNKENTTPFSAPHKKSVRSHHKTPMADYWEEDNEYIMSSPGRRKKVAPQYLADIVKTIDFGSVADGSEGNRHVKAEARFAR